MFEPLPTHLSHVVYKTALKIVRVDEQAQNGTPGLCHAISAALLSHIEDNVTDFPEYNTSNFKHNAKYFLPEFKELLSKGTRYYPYVWKPTKIRPRIQWLNKQIKATRTIQPLTNSQRNKVYREVLKGMLKDKDKWEANYPYALCNYTATAIHKGKYLPYSENIIKLNIEEALPEFDNLIRKPDIRRQSYRWKDTTFPDRIKWLNKQIKESQ